eukprot:2169615-Pyramimonas_sp.AAC.1
MVPWPRWKSLVCPLLDACGIGSRALRLAQPGACWRAQDLIPGRRARRRQDAPRARHPPEALATPCKTHAASG